MVLFVWGGFFFLKIEENQEIQTAVSNEYPFSIAPRKQNLVGYTRHHSVDIIMDIMFSDIPISLSTNHDFT